MPFVFKETANHAKVSGDAQRKALVRRRAAPHRTAKPLSCPRCGISDQVVHQRIRRAWRHLACFQFEVRRHADMPRVDCQSCGQTTQVPAPRGA